MGTRHPAWSVRVAWMRSRASDVARLEAVAAAFILNSRPFLCVLFMFFGRATADARERIPRLPTGHSYGSNMNAAVIIIVGTIAANTSPPGETPSLPKHDDRID